MIIFDIDWRSVWNIWYVSWMGIDGIEWCKLNIGMVRIGVIWLLLFILKFIVRIIGIRMVVVVLRRIFWSWCWMWWRRNLIRGKRGGFCMCMGVEGCGVRIGSIMIWWCRCWMRLFMRICWWRIWRGLRVWRICWLGCCCWCILRWICMGICCCRWGWEFEGGELLFGVRWGSSFIEVLDSV